MTKMLRLEMDEFKRLVARNDKLLKAADPHLKFRNRPTGGYHSRKEHDRAVSLKLMEKAGDIYDLAEQVPFELVPPQPRTASAEPERPVVYYADFVFKDRQGNLHVEDVKSPATRTPDYIIKRKLMRHVHGIVVEEI
jgi:hypothetical protein